MKQSEAKALVYAGSYIILRGGDEKPVSEADQEALTTLELILGSAPENYTMQNKSPAQKALAVACLSLAECSDGELEESHDLSALEGITTYLAQATPEDAEMLGQAAKEMEKVELSMLGRPAWTECYRDWLVIFGVIEE